MSFKSDDVSKIHLDDEESISRSKNARNELFTNPSHIFFNHEKNCIVTVVTFPGTLLLINFIGSVIDLPLTKVPLVTCGDQQLSICFQMYNVKHLIHKSH